MSAGFDTYRKFVRPLGDVAVVHFLASADSLPNNDQDTMSTSIHISRVYTSTDRYPRSRSAIIPCLVRRLSV